MTPSTAIASPPSDLANGPGSARSLQATAVRGARQALCMTQEILAGAAGVSARTVLRAERGDEISAENLRAICSVLKLDAGALATPDPAEAYANTSAAEDGVGADAEGAPPVRARITWRRALAVIAALLAVTGSMNLATGYVASLGDWNLAGREMSAVGGSQVAARTNAALALLSEGKVPDASGMGTSRDYWVVNCAPSPPAFWVLGVNGSCDTGAMRLDVRRSDAEGMAFAVGPVSDAFLESFALQVADPPGTTLRVTFAKDAGTPRQGSFWFDPRGSDPRLLPRVSPDLAHMHVVLAKSGSTR